MTEKALGYTTIGGDMEGGFALMANIPKTVIIELLNYLLEARFAWLTSLRMLMTTQASAELADNQEDERDLMPFVVADRLLELLVGERMTPVDGYRMVRSELGEIYSAQQLIAWTKRFIILFRRSVFKWVQGPLSLHFGNLDLDRESALRLPVTNAFYDLNELDKLEEETSETD
jgi:NAD+ synthase (glutamine-hydrolysing)